MRKMLVIPVCAVVAACDTVAPVQGTGFNTPQYQAQREAQLAGQGAAGNPLLPPPAISQDPWTAEPAAGTYSTGPGNGGVERHLARTGFCRGFQHPQYSG